MGKGKTQQGSSEQLKTLRTLCHCLVSPHCSALCCPESHKASAKHSIHNKEKQTVHHPSSLDVQRTSREIFVDCSESLRSVVLTPCTAAENKKTSQRKTQYVVAATGKIFCRIEDRVWHWSPLHEKRWWENPTGGAGPRWSRLFDFLV